MQALPEQNEGRGNLRLKEARLPVHYFSRASAVSRFESYSAHLYFPVTRTFILRVLRCLFFVSGGL